MVNGFLRHCGGSGHEVIRFFDIDKAAGGYLGPGQKLAAARLEGEGDDHDAVLGQVLAVAQNDVSYVADSQSVDQNVADLYFLAHCRAVLGEFEHIAGAKEENILFVISQLSGDLVLGLEVAELAVDRDRESGLDQVVDEFDILLAGVAGGMDILCDDIRALHHELIDNAGHGFLIARNGAG